MESGSGSCGNKATPRQEKRQTALCTGHRKPLLAVTVRRSAGKGGGSLVLGAKLEGQRLPAGLWAPGPTPESGPPPGSSAPARAPALRGPHGPPDHLF